jgi:photosystem I subunit PsaN
MASTTLLGSSTVIASLAALAVKDLKASYNGVRVSCAPMRFAVRASAGSEETSSRRDVVKMAGAMLALGLFGGVGNAKAGLTEDLLAKSAANKELNDRKRLATSGANTARAYTVQNGSCQFPNNFTGCEDLAKQTGKVQFLSDDLAIECEGKEAYHCGEDVFWKGKK